jgi:hypothetical protein
MDRGARRHHAARIRIRKNRRLWVFNVTVTSSIGKISRPSTREGSISSATFPFGRDPHSGRVRK